MRYTKPISLFGVEVGDTIMYTEGKFNIDRSSMFRVIKNSTLSKSVLLHISTEFGLYTNILWLDPVLREALAASWAQTHNKAPKVFVSQTPKGVAGAKRVPVEHLLGQDDEI
jgi:hypothetical protein